MDATLAVRKTSSNLVVLLISLLALVVIEGRFAASDQETGELTKTSQASKGSRGFSKFSENIQFMRSKQSLALRNSTTSFGTGKSSSSSENVVQQSIIPANQQVNEETSSFRSNSQQEQQQPITSGFSASLETSSQQQQQQMIYGLVEGVPGVDFPGLTSVPNTDFSCRNVPYEPGMYADESTGCQVYHLCFDGRRESFLCSVGTIFNQANLACDFWHAVDCSKSSQYYATNREFGKSSPEPTAAGQQQQQQQKTRQESFSQLVENQIRLPFPVRVTGTQNQAFSFMGNQKSPSATSSFESSRAESFSSSSKPLLVSGKTSLNSQTQQQLGRFISPSRQVKLINHLSSMGADFRSTEPLDTLGNDLRLMGANSVPVGSALAVTSADNKTEPFRISGGSLKSIKSGWPRAEIKGDSRVGQLAGVGAQDNGQWRPYSRAKSRGPPSTSGPSSALSTANSPEISPTTTAWPPTTRHTRGPTISAISMDADTSTPVPSFSTFEPATITTTPPPPPATSTVTSRRPSPEPETEVESPSPPPSSTVTSAAAGDTTGASTPSASSSTATTRNDDDSSDDDDDDDDKDKRSIIRASSSSVEYAEEAEGPTSEEAKRSSRR